MDEDFITSTPSKNLHKFYIPLILDFTFHPYTMQVVGTHLWGYCLLCAGLLRSSFLNACKSE